MFKMCYNNRHGLAKEFDTACVEAPCHVCFDVVFAIPQLGHKLIMVESHRETLLFIPHHPETCFETKILSILGRLDIARSIPCHQIVSKSEE